MVYGLPILATEREEPALPSSHVGRVDSSHSCTSLYGTRLAGSIRAVTLVL
jgi:hypothetical protein